MIDEIHNTDLRLEQIPSATSVFSIIWEFALTFDGYDRIKDIGVFANKIASEFEVDQATVKKLSLTELRACLFYEQRRNRHSQPMEDEPEGLEREYISSLLTEITKRVENHHTD
jgi:hypothetical protein